MESVTVGRHLLHLQKGCFFFCGGGGFLDFWQTQEVLKKGIGAGQEVDGKKLLKNGGGQKKKNLWDKWLFVMTQHDIALK